MRLGHRHATVAAGRLPRAGAGASRRDAARVPRAAHRCDRSGGRARARCRRAGRRARRERRRLHRSARRLPRRRRARSRRARPRRVRRPGPRGPSARRVDARALGWRSGPRLVGGDPPESLRRAAPRRTHERSRLRGTGAPRGLRRRSARRRGAREPRPRLPRADRDPCARARRALALGHRVRWRLDGIPRRARHGATSRGGGLRDVPVGAFAAGTARAHATRVVGAGHAYGEEGHVGAATSSSGTSRSRRRRSRRRRRAPRATRSTASTWSTSPGRAGTCASRWRARRAAATW